MLVPASEDVFIRTLKCRPRNGRDWVFQCNRLDSARVLKDYAGQREPIPTPIIIYIRLIVNWDVASIQMRGNEKEGEVFVVQITRILFACEGIINL